MEAEKKKNNIVMVPSDFSEVADFALNHATGIAKLLNFKICVLHAINKETKSNLKKANKDEQAVIEQLEETVAKLRNEHGVEAEYVAKEGSIFSVIPEVAFEIGANFLVMGTHGKIGVQHVIGSYAWKVVTASPVPVIVVQKKPFDKGYHNIIMNIDHTMESKQKINWAVYIAKIFNSTIHLTIHQDKDEFLRNRIRNNVAQIKRILDENGIQYISEGLTSGNIGKQLEAYAQKIDADLFMIMTNPDKNTIMMSPWDEQLLFNSLKTPVMCINPIDSFITVYRR